MLNTSRRSLLIIVSLLCITGGSCAAYGMFWITSNIVHVNIQYTVALSYSVSGRRVLLTALVTNNGGPVGAGIDVEFYYSLNGGDWTHFATEPTNRRGVARARYTITGNGEYAFTARVLY